MDTHRPHFLIITFPVQSHINPALHLASRLVSTTDALVTFSTAESAHRRMFPDTAPASDGNLTFAPYPDGYETRGYKPHKPESDSLKISDSDDTGSNNVDGFASILLSLAARGRRVTCVVHTLLLNWAADVARAHGVPSAQYWIQPATVFAAYYHYFHGYESLIDHHSKDPRFSVKLPGLPPIQIRELPSFLTSATSNDGPYSTILPRFRECFEKLEPGAKILMNTFDELEPEALASIERVSVVPIGPILSPDKPGHDLVKCNDESRYMDWLDSKQERSVAYVSFGSISVIKKAQMEEISKGLKASGRPYLWVVRNDCRHEGVELEEDGEENAMVVEWCSQVRVLNHPSVGCFVTHCGWNSTTESLAAGVPTVGVPQWSDQVTNAMLMEKEWGMGVRGENNEDGVLEGEELRRCLDLVMGEGERGREIRRNAVVWSEKAREAVGEGGSSDRNLRAFVAEFRYMSHTY